MRLEKFEMIKKDVFGFSHDLYIAITAPMAQEELAESWRDIRNEVMMSWQEKKRMTFPDGTFTCSMLLTIWTN